MLRGRAAYVRCLTLRACRPHCRHESDAEFRLCKSEVTTPEQGLEYLQDETPKKSSHCPTVLLQPVNLEIHPPTMGC